MMHSTNLHFSYLHLLWKEQWFIRSVICWFITVSCLQVRCICVLVPDAGAVSVLVSAAAGVNCWLSSQSDEHQPEELCGHSDGSQWPASILLHLPCSQRASSSPSAHQYQTRYNYRYRPAQQTSQNNRRKVPRARRIRLVGRRLQYWRREIVRVRLAAWTWDVAGQVVWGYTEAV